MTGLLVSVRNGPEALAALEGGADLIDVKDPHRGSLGAAGLRQWEEVRRAVGDNAPLSVALGELLVDDVDALLPQTVGFQYAKLGLAGCGNEENWYDHWSAVLQNMPRGVTPVAVCYADWETAQAPLPEEILHYAEKFNCGAYLIDTFSKERGGMFDYFSEGQLTELIYNIKSRNMLAVLGGSLGIDCLSSAMELQPDYIAVRGAACRGERTDRIDAALVRELSQRIASHRAGTV